MGLVRGLFGTRPRSLSHFRVSIVASVLVESRLAFARGGRARARGKD
jgi:hypothetical protein